jgi:hypothetical protein
VILNAVTIVIDILFIVHQNQCRNFLLKTSQAELSKLQRVACLGITGAIKTTPTAAMEVLLGLPPLHLQVEAEAMIGSYRLSCNEQWKPKI